MKVNNTRLLSNVLVVFFIAIFGCGDGYVDGGDDNDSFIPGGSDGREGSRCSEFNDQCVSDNICVLSACVNAFDRSYDFTIETLTVTEKTVNGEAWDGFGGLPDPQVSVYINGSTRAECATRGAVDTTRVNFDHNCILSFRSGDLLEIYVYDEDVSDDDVIFVCEAIIRPNVLRGRRLFCDTEHGQITISVNPRG